MKKIKSVIHGGVPSGLFFIFFLLLLFGCRRNTDDYLLSPANFSVEKTWLHKNGGSYKQESIHAETASGKKLIGKLNWQKAGRYSWKGAEYIDIPFEFEASTPFVYGADKEAYNGFNLVMRKKPDGYEAAIRYTAYHVTLESIKAPVIIQTYELLNGREANAWLVEGDDRYYPLLPSAAPEAKEVVEINRMMVCSSVTVTTYRGYCYSVANGRGETLDEVVCVTRPTTKMMMKCDSVEEGDWPPIDTGGGGGGGDAPPKPPKEDPCADAKAESQKAGNKLNEAHVQNTINQIGNIATLNKEKGFAIMEEVRVDPRDPQNPDKVTVHRSYTTDIETGSETSVNISVQTSNLNGLVGTVHTHPAGGYSAPSAVDIYGVIEAMNFNFGIATQNSFVGNFVLAANGNTYALTVHNAALANTFFNTKANNLNDREWSADSDIGKAFDKAKNHFEKVYKGLEQAQLLAFEEAMAAVLDQYNTGVTLHKKENGSSGFKPINRKATQTTDKKGRSKTTYNNPC